MSQELTREQEQKYTEQFLLATKKDVEKREIEILLGESNVKIGKEDSRFRPKLSDENKGFLLRGFKPRNFVESESEKKKRLKRESDYNTYLCKLLGVT